MSPRAPSRSLFRTRRGQRGLLLAGVLVTAAASIVASLRQSTAPYTPGVEAAESTEITRRLSRTSPASAEALAFTDVAKEAGVTFRHFHGRRSTQLPEDMGSGLAWGDYDGDGDPDLFLVNVSGPLTASPAEHEGSPARSALYRNDGGRFVDVTEDARAAVRGIGMGAAWGDYDGDGDLDLAVTRFGRSVLLRNDGSRFSDVSAGSGIAAEEGFWSGATWADYDRDGDLDLYVCGYVRYEPGSGAGAESMQFQAKVPFTLNPSSYAPERNLLLQNDGGRFRDVAREAGVDNPTGRSLSAAFADLDGDLRPDLYVANDISDNAMYWNRGDGTFEDVSHSAWVADYRGAMGLAVGDWEGDGDLDIHVTHWIAQENALYVNQAGKIPAAPGEPLHFTDEADFVGLGQVALDYVGWATGFADFDLDGRLDLYAVNGSTFQREDDAAHLVPMRNLLFWSGGAERGFFTSSGADFAKEGVGRGGATADYDGDGDLDLAMVVNGGDARLLRNDTAPAGRHLRVVLRGNTSAGPPPRTPTFAEGARVTVEVGSRRLVALVAASPSYLSQSPPGEVHFGLGQVERVDRLRIDWPDGVTQTFEGLPAGATVRVAEGSEPQLEGARASAPPRGREEVLRFWKLYGEATSERTARSFASAARLYEEALAIDPGHEDCLYYLGQSRLELGDWAGSRDALQRLVRVNPRSARGHLALGALDASPDPAHPMDLRRAEAHFREAHRINGEETGALVRLGEVLLVRGDAAEAREHFESAARTNPKSVEAAFLAAFTAREASDDAGAARHIEAARRAAEAEAPVKGVLSEGDRKAKHGAPPPRLEVRTLYADIAAGVATSEPEVLFERARERTRSLRERGTPAA